MAHCQIDAIICPRDRTAHFCSQVQVEHILVYLMQGES